MLCSWRSAAKFKLRKQIHKIRNSNGEGSNANQTSLSTQLDQIKKSAPHEYKPPRRILPPTIKESCLLTFLSGSSLVSGKTAWLIPSCWRLVGRIEGLSMVPVLHIARQIYRLTISLLSLSGVEEAKLPALSISTTSLSE